MESNIENHDCEFLIFNFQFGIKIQMDENHTDQHREEKLLVSDIGPSVLGEQKSLYRRNIETLVWRQIVVAYICFITIIFLFASPQIIIIRIKVSALQ